LLACLMMMIVQEGRNEGRKENHSFFHSFFLGQGIKSNQIRQKKRVHQETENIVVALLE